MRADWLVDELRAHGAQVDEYGPGWCEVGSELTDVRGWFIHHTASGPGSDGAGDLAYIYANGSLVPEYNAYLERSGLITVGAGGKCNHAGKGGDYPPGHPEYAARGRKPIPWLPYGSANGHTVCLAIANDGVGEPYTEAQMDAVLAFCRAVNAGAGCPNDYGLSHWEWTGRKIDPAGQSRWAYGGAMWDMDVFRDSVISGSAPSPRPPEELDMTDDQAAQLATVHQVLTEAFPHPDIKDPATGLPINATWAAGRTLQLTMDDVLVKLDQILGRLP